MKLIVGHRACGILFRYVKHVGGKWLLPANVCPVVPFTFLEAHVPFEFVDIDKNTLCISEADVVKKIREDATVKGAVYVHTYGGNRDVNGFIGHIRNVMKDFKVVDDRCLCRPDLNPPVVSADMVLYSTGYAKYVDLGEGGFAWMQDKEEIDVEDVPFMGDTIEDYYKHLQATNKCCKDSEVPTYWIDATIERDEKTIQRYFDKIQNQLPLIDKHKEEINEIYSMVVSYETLDADMNQWRYSILVERKEELLNKIFDAGLFASSHYCPSSRLFSNEHYPNAEWLYRHIINLFNDRYISVNQAMLLAKILIAE